MNRDSVAYETRSRNACEPCRRKKTKCPGEQPSCSFCLRLNQKCTYAQKLSSGRVHKVRSGSQEQINRLESQIERINGTLQALTDPCRVNLSAAIQESETGPKEPSNHHGAAPVEPPRAKFHPSAFPYPPPETWAHFAEIYRTKIHFQPFPLFDCAELTSRFSRWPLYLLQSFLAICLVFEDDPFYRQHKWDAQSYYIKSSRETVIPLATEGASSLEVLQTLCLLTLCDIAAGDDIRASMNIAIASRLARSRAHSPNTATRRAPAMNEDEARCCWTVFILENAFTKDQRTLIVDQSPLLHLPSIGGPSQPPPLLDSNPSNRSSVSIDTSCSRGPGIFSCCASILSIWGKMIAYGENMRSGQSGNPWLVSSAYSCLLEDIYRFEISLPQQHRFKNLGLSNRSSDDIYPYREYWSSWLLLQATFHSAHALLNHPIFHVVGHERLGNEQSKFCPPSFVQNTIDQAIFHAGWTSCLIRIANDLNIEINDPVIGHQVIVCATVHWIFSFANNASVAERAISDLGKCQHFIVEIASRWPQFEQKATVLDQLQNLVRQTDSPLGDRGLPGVSASLLWDFIDPSSMKPDMPNFSPSATVGERVPTDHLAQLHERPNSGRDEYQYNRFGTGENPDSASLMQFPGFFMDEGFLSSETISESLDLRYMPGFGGLGDL